MIDDISPTPIATQCVLRERLPSNRALSPTTNEPRSWETQRLPWQTSKSLARRPAISSASSPCISNEGLTTTPPKTSQELLGNPWSPATIPAMNGRITCSYGVATAKRHESHSKQKHSRSTTGSPLAVALANDFEPKRDTENTKRQPAISQRVAHHRLTCLTPNASGTTESKGSS